MDFVFAVQFIWLNGWVLRGEVKEITCNPAITFITQFSLMASLGWYVVMAINFYFSISNPFKKPSAKIKKYHVATWTIAAISAFIAAAHSGYREDYRLCWIEKVANGANAWNWVLYWSWLILSATICVGILIYGIRKLKKEPKFARETLARRKETLWQTGVYTLVFTVYWIVGGIIWFVVQGKGTKSFFRMVGVPRGHMFNVRTTYWLSDERTDSTRMVNAAGFLLASDDTEVIQDQHLAYLFSIVAPLLGLLDVCTW